MDVVNEIGALANICATVAKCGGNIANMDLKERDQEFVTMHVDVDVRDLAHLNEITRALADSRVVVDIDRRLSRSSDYLP